MEARLKPETELCLAALRSFICQEQSEVLGELLCCDVDWDLINHFAVAHKICKPLADVLSRIDAASAHLDLIKAEAAVIQRRSMMLMAKLFGIQQALKIANIEFVFVKGPVLATMLYGSIQRRSFFDLDIFIREKDATKAGAVLRQAGFTPTQLGGMPQTDLFFTSPYFLKLATEKDFSDPSSMFFVDLHWAPGTRFYSSEEIIASAIDVPVGEHSIRGLEPNMHFLYLCAHAAKHDWDTLIWISDIAYAIQRDDLFDWGEVRRLSEKIGISKIVQLTVYLASVLLKVEVPESLAVPSKNLHDVKRAADEIILRLDERLPPIIEVSSIPSWVRCWQTSDRKIDVVNKVLKDIFVPTLFDWSRLPLPAPLYPLYYLIHPSLKAFFFARAQVTRMVGFSGNMVV